MTNNKNPHIKARQIKTRNSCTRARFLANMRQQSTDVLESGDWSRAKDLRGLLAVLKQARPRARSVIFCGVRFPLQWSLSSTVACCPETGQRLIARLDI